MDILQAVYEMQGIIPTGFAFLFVYLPLSLFVYYLCPLRYRPHCLLLISLLFYAIIEPSGVMLLAGSIVFDYAVIQGMGRCGKQLGRRRLLFLLSMLKSLGLFVGCGLWVQHEGEIPLIGVPVFVLLSISCMQDVYHMHIQGEQSLVRFALHCSFYPRLYTGPLQSYEALTSQLEGVRLQPGEVAGGAGQLIQGVFKLAVMGGGLYALYQSAMQLGEQTALSAWMQVFAYAFGLYYLLSGFADTAQGLGRMYGLHLPGNMYYPFQSRSITDFLDRFHMTIGDFLRENVHQKLTAKRSHAVWDILGLLLTGVLFGLWFGIRLNYALWGGYLALFLLLERYVYRQALDHIPLLFCRIGTLFVVLVGFPLFMASSPVETVQLWRNMFAAPLPHNDQALYLLTSNWLLLMASGFLATNAVNLGWVKLRRRFPRGAEALFGALNIAILVGYLMQ